MNRASALAAILSLTTAIPAAAQTVPIAIDVKAKVHPISPLVYGVNFATTAQLADLNAPINRSGGDSASLYNWQIDARNAGKDWFFESQPCSSDIFDQHGDGFVALSRAGGAEPILTVPMVGWVAKLGPNRQRLASFSIGKYGLQADFDENGLTDAGNGLTLDGAPIIDNDPTDAAQPDTSEDERKWLDHLIAKWGRAGSGGVRFYLMDNEPSYWHGNHRDVHPEGAHAREIADKVIAYAQMVKAADPGAKVIAPEEWGWNGYRYSGFDQQWASTHNWGDHTPDRDAQTKGMDYLPWLLTQWKANGHPVDIVSVHYYPQGGEYNEAKDDISPRVQLSRNRSTRELWDPSYKSTSWIDSPVGLIPRLRDWIETYYYPGTPIAITEYSWGAERTMGGATAQADVMGILGREGVDIATRWATPETGSPTYLAMKLYRNYDGHKSGFGETSVSADVPDPDKVSAFAATRADGALTVIVINKQLDQAAPVELNLSHYAGKGRTESWRLAEDRLFPLPEGRYDGAVKATLPAQSVTLFILHGD